ncbi:MAG TPA: hypothetical protein VMV86_00860 [Methanosarcinales archaeon]|nr:hypothetical protein [Methanosarcinales archaeon]
MADIVFSFPVPVVPTGMCYNFITKQLYVCSTVSGYIYVYTLDGVLVDQWLHGCTAPNGMDIDVDDPDILWITDQSTMVKISISTHTKLQSWNMSYAINGVATLPGLYMWLGLTTGIHRVLKSNPSGEFINVPWSFGISDLAWDGIYLWVSGSSTQIQAINLVDYSLIYSFTGTSNSITALTTDGIHMWTGDEVNSTVVQFYIEKKDARNAAYYSNGVSVIRIRNLKFLEGTMTPSRNMKHKVGVGKYGGTAL